MSVWKLKALLLAIAVCASATTNAQVQEDSENKCLAASVFVTVKNKCNTPIQNAQVKIGTTTVYTAANGIATFPAVAAGNYTLVVTLSPYITQNQFISLTCGQIYSPSFTMLYQLPSPKHSADSTFDGKISLSEMTRVTQLYNAGAYYCSPGSEDGFAPGSGSHACTPHSSDYNTQNWVISFSELQRVIQFYNAGGYYRSVGTEDNFAPVTCAR